VQYSHRIWVTHKIRLIKVCLIETYNEVHIGKYLPDSFPIPNGLKQRYAILLLLFNFGLEYTIWKVQEKLVELNSMIHISFPLIPIARIY
jgi:hypothetical protein